MPKVETTRHQEAFNYYYELGYTRSIPQVAQKIKASHGAVKKWSRDFNWRERVIQRDIDNNPKLERKSNDAVVNTKASHRKDIQLAMQPIRALINSAIVERENPETGKKESVVSFAVKDPKGMLSMITSLEKLIKADLLLMGEADSRSEEKITIVNDLSGAGDED